MIISKQIKISLKKTGNISLMKMDNFNWNQYIENYQDLQEGGINSEKTALWNYKKYGKQF